MFYNNKRLALSAFWVVLGAVLLGLSVAGKLDSSIYAGMGGALIAVGALQVIRYVRYRNQAEYKEKVDTEAGDERNAFLRMKSWSLAGSVAFMLQGIGVIVAAILGERTVQLVLTCSALLILAVYLVSLAVLNKKY